MSSSGSGLSIGGGNTPVWQYQAKENQVEKMRQQFLNPNDTEHKKLKKAAQDFEAVFVQQLLEAMDKTVDREDSMMGGGSAEDTWRGMMNEQVAHSMTSAPGGSGLGLAESIYRQMAAQISPDQAKPDRLTTVKPATTGKL